MSLGGVSPAGGMLVADATLLGDINTGTLRIGSYNDAANGGAGTITAGNISVDGPVSLNGHAATLPVNSLGSIVENGANGIQVGTLIGTLIGTAAAADAGPTPIRSARWPASCRADRSPWSRRTRPIST